MLVASRGYSVATGDTAEYARRFTGEVWREYKGERVDDTGDTLVTFIVNELRGATAEEAVDRLRRAAGELSWVADTIRGDLS